MSTPPDSTPPAPTEPLTGPPSAALDTDASDVPRWPQEGQRSVTDGSVEPADAEPAEAGEPAAEVAEPGEFAAKVAEQSEGASWPAVAEDSPYSLYIYIYIPVVVPVLVGTDYKPIKLPKPTLRLFEEPALRDALCGFCLELQNVECGEDGRVTRTICDSCRSALSRHALHACEGGSPGCMRCRVIDPVGAIAALCKVCHQACPARSKRNRGRMRTRKDRGQKLIVE